VFAYRIVLANVVERFLEIGDEARGREWLPAARTGALGGIFAGAPLELDADGGGSLDDMEELAKG
jgi:hypothetical protein